MARRKSVDTAPPTAQEDKVEWMVQAIILQSASIKELAHENQGLRESIVNFLQQYEEAMHEQIEAIPQLTKEIEILRAAIDDLRQEYEDVMRRQSRLWSPGMPVVSAPLGGQHVAPPHSAPVGPHEGSTSQGPSESGSLW